MTRMAVGTRRSEPKGSREGKSVVLSVVLLNTWLCFIHLDLLQSLHVPKYAVA